MKEIIATAGLMFAGWYVLREYDDSKRLSAPMFSQQLKQLREQDF